MIKSFSSKAIIKKGNGVARFSRKHINPNFGSIMIISNLNDNPGSRDRNYGEISFDDPELTCIGEEVFFPSDGELGEPYDYDDPPKSLLR